MSGQSGATSKRLMAVCGKGGVGKTAFTAMTARALIESNRAGRLLLIDADPAMGLPSALGVTVGRAMGQIREEIIRTARGGRKEEKVRLVDTIDYMAFEALHETDDFALLAMGRTESLGCFCPVNDLLRGAIEALSNNFDTILIDGEAGLEQINRQVMRRVDTLIVVSDPTSRGMQTVALIRKMVENDDVLECDRLGLVFNRVQGNEELLRQSASDTGVEVFGFVPYDEDIVHHDLMGKPLTELAAGSVGMAAVREIVENCILN